MKRIYTFAAIAILCVVSLSYLAHLETRQPTAKSTLSRKPDISGKWFQRSRTVNGQLMPDPPDLYLVVTNDGRMEHHVPNGNTWLSGSTIVSNESFRLEWNDQLATVDTSGYSNWSEVTKGICRVEGDRLTICYASKNQPRPTVFATGDTDGAGSVMFVFARHK